MLTNAELEKYLNTKPDNIIKKDIKIDPLNDSDNTPKPVPSTSNGVNTYPRCAPVNYAESSASDGGSIHGDSEEEWDFDLNVKPTKQLTKVRPHPE